MKIIKKLHRWLSVIVAVQLVIWIVTGLYFNLVNSSWYSTKVFQQSVDTDACEHSVIPVSELPLERAPVAVELKSNLFGCFYLVHFDRVFHQYQAMDATAFAAATGDKLPPLNKEQITTMALNSYSGPGRVANSVLLPSGQSSDGKQQNPVWRVDFQDHKDTSIFVHSVLRQVIRHENANSRFHKFMFKLHFMDYFNSGSFNHWLLKLFAAMTLALTVTGVWWLLQRIANKQLGH